MCGEVVAAPLSLQDTVYPILRKKSLHFCEKSKKFLKLCTAVRKKYKMKRLRRKNIFWRYPFSLAALASSPKGAPFEVEVKFPAKPQSLRAQPLPLGGAVAQRLRGYKSAEPKKTVKRSSRRTGVNLQFFPVQPSSLGLKGASSPFFVAPARRNRWHFSGSLLVAKENIPRQAVISPAQRRALTRFLAAPRAVCRAPHNGRRCAGWLRSARRSPA